MKKGARKISTMLIVLGLLCLAIGLIIAASGLARLEHEQGYFFRVGFYYGLASVALFSVRFFVFRLPDILRDRRSETARRRRENSLNFRRPKPSSPRDGDDEGLQQGSVLIFVLVVLGVVSVLSVRSIVLARASHQQVDVRTQVELLKLAALDGVRDAMQRLADDPDLTVDHPGEDWARRMEATDPAGIARAVTITDAQRVFDLNNLAIGSPESAGFSPAEILGNIMAMCGTLRSGLQIQALQDAVDENDTGAFENKRYENEELPNRVPDRALYGMDELFHVEGWTPEMFRNASLKTPGNPFDFNLVDCVGLIPAARNNIIPVNIYSADPPALKALFGPANEGIVERMLIIRRGPVRSRIDFLAGLLGEDVFTGVAPYLSVASSWFEIRSAARNQDGRSVQLQALAYRDARGRVELVKAMF